MSHRSHFSSSLPEKSRSRIFFQAMQTGYIAITTQMLEIYVSSLRWTILNFRCSYRSAILTISHWDSSNFSNSSTHWRLNCRMGSVMTNRRRGTYAEPIRGSIGLRTHSSNWQPLSTIWGIHHGAEWVNPVAERIAAFSSDRRILLAIHSESWRRT